MPGRCDACGAWLLAGACVECCGPAVQVVAPVGPGMYREPSQRFERLWAGWCAI
jgi:hypothetical protein